MTKHWKRDGFDSLDDALQRPGGESKYGNRRTVIDGIAFDSAAEARRFVDLKLLELAGEISYLELQPRYDLVVNRVKVATYVGDFKYFPRGEQMVVEDVKGVRTPVYRLKAKLMLALYGIEIRETG